MSGHVIHIISLTLCISFVILGIQAHNASSVSNNIDVDCSKYDMRKKAITVYCDSTLPEVQRAINNESIIKRDSNTKNGIWLLNSSLIITRGATLTFSHEDGVTWLKVIAPITGIMKDKILINNTDPENINDKKAIKPYRIEVFGRLYVNGVKITSWDPKSNYYAIQSADGNVPRPHIIIRENASASSITNSEIAYLGYNGTKYNTSRTQGINMYGGDNTVIRDTKIHDLWYGFYSDSVGHVIIENNTIYNNHAYGIDPHSSSHDMVIRNNRIINNYAGLVCSHLCYNILFENNQIDDNKNKGILLSRNVTNSTIRYNNISNTNIGIAISQSHNNYIHDNNIKNSIFGLQLIHGASYNTINNNTITNPINCGFAISDKAEHNIIMLNSVVDSKQIGICLTKGVDLNSFDSNSINSDASVGLLSEKMLGDAYKRR